MAIGISSLTLSIRTPHDKQPHLRGNTVVPQIVPTGKQQHTLEHTRRPPSVQVSTWVDIEHS